VINLDGKDYMNVPRRNRMMAGGMEAIAH